MPHFRRHAGKLYGLAVLLILCSTLMVSVQVSRHGRVELSPSSVAVAAEAESDGQTRVISEQVAGQVERLRESLCLTSADLAVLGATEAEASSALEALVVWVERNESALADARVSVYQARRDARLAQTDRHTGGTGHGPGGSLSTSESALARAEADLTRLVEQAGVEVDRALSFDKGMLRRSYAARGDLARPYRYIDSLSAGQLDQLRRLGGSSGASSVLSFHQTQQLKAALDRQSNTGVYVRLEAELWRVESSDSAE